MLARLVNLLVDPEISPAIKTNVVHILASVCRGNGHSASANTAAVIEAGVLAILLSGLVTAQEERLTEACLLCLVAILQHKEAPVEVTLFFYGRGLCTGRYF